MYAVVNTGGKQAKVVKDAVIVVEKLDTEVGDAVTLPVVFLADGERVLATAAELAGVSVSAEVVEHFKGDKQKVFKFQKRKGYKRMKGHRQNLTAVRILEITVGEAPAKTAKAPKASTPEKAAEPKAAAKAKDKAPAAEVAAPEAVKAATPEVAEDAVAAPVKESAAAKPATAVSEVGQCEAVKADGTRCTNKAKEGSKYCGVHAKKHES